MPCQRAEERPCVRCGRPFRPRPDQLERGHGKCCSRSCGSTFAASTSGRNATGDGRPGEPYWFEGELVCRVPLGCGAFALISGADRVTVGRYLWRRHTGGYAIASPLRDDGPKKVYMHRLIMQPPAGLEVDHLNHNKTDNRRSNLRVCTRKENVANTRQPIRTCGLCGRSCIGGGFVIHVRACGRRSAGP